MHNLTLSIAAALLAAASVDGAFDGPYAPENWTFTTDAGGFVKLHSTDELFLVGGDIGFAGDTDILITVAAAGTWSFRWTYSCIDCKSPAFDSAYYLVNAQAFHLADGIFSEGRVNGPVRQGDVIGFRVDTVDGIFGPGVLIITNFSAPVPGPGSLALLIASFGLRHRRRYDPRDG